MGKRNQRNIVTFELRKEKDDDILEALKQVPSSVDRSDIIRAALRRYFFDANSTIIHLKDDNQTSNSRNLKCKIDGNIELKEKEKSNDEVANDLDDLLGTF